MPSVLSLLRLGLAGAFPLLTGVWVRAGVIVAAAFSDFADGLIARRYGAESWVGGLLDAVADKAFVLTVLAVLTVEGRLEVWQTGLLLSRDAAVLASVAWVIGRRRWDAFRQMPSRLLGKATTAAVLAVLLLGVIVSEDGAILDLVWGIAAVLSVAAAGDYIAYLVRNDRRVRNAGVDVRPGAVRNEEA